MTIATILAGFKEILELIQSSSATRNEKQLTADKAFCEAVTMTESVLRNRSPDEPNQVEYGLTNAWHQASLAFRDAGDDKLMKLCNIKGYYWMNPDQWTDERLEDAGIKLKRMRRELNKRLAPR